MIRALLACATVAALAAALLLLQGRYDRSGTYCTATYPDRITTEGQGGPAGCQPLRP